MHFTTQMLTPRWWTILLVISHQLLCNYLSYYTTLHEAVNEVSRSRNREIFGEFITWCQRQKPCTGARHGGPVVPSFIAVYVTLKAKSNVSISGFNRMQCWNSKKMREWMSWNSQRYTCLTEESFTRCVVPEDNKQHMSSCNAIATAGWQSDARDIKTAFKEAWISGTRL